MTVQTYSTQDGRINEIKGEMLAHSEPQEVLALGCSMKQAPRNRGDNISYRRVIPVGGATTNANTINRWSVTATSYEVQDGVTPVAAGITYQDVNIQLKQYACLFSYTDKAAELYEDDIPEDMRVLTGETMGLIREMVRFGSMKACTNASYAGGTSRATVDSAITLNLLRNTAKTLLANGAMMKSRILAPGPDYDTSAIEAGFIVFVHTDCEPDIRDLPGFVPAAKYANKQVLNENEIGSCERFRFIVSKELAPYLAAGAAVGTTGLTSAGASNVDVYPFIIVGGDACFDIALRGMNSFEMVDISHKQKDKADVFGQRGYVGAMFWSAVLVANNGYMAVIEAGTTDTSV